MTSLVLPKLIAVVGPTASGKSDLAVCLAKKFNGEIISADSRQVYRGMDIGTGKITKKEMRGVPHHLLNVASPKLRFTVARYKKLAQRAINKISANGKLPIVCGGTGLYIDVLLGNISIPEVKPDLKLRAKLEKITTNDLYKKLQKLDPKRVKTIDRFNRRRLIRALEIIYKTGKPVPPLAGRAEPDSRPGTKYDILYLGIKKSPDELKKLIARRLEKRLKQGLIAEVKKLRRNGVSWKRLDDFGLEYRWVARYLQNKIPLRQRADRDKSAYEEMQSQLQKEIGHYAKRQMTWFKRNKKIRWVNNSKEALLLYNKLVGSKHR